jgi:Domain of unknown function (DUF4395)
MARFFTFPNPVNNAAARLVASGVIVMAVVAIAARQPWISALIAYGFVARAAAGPRLSPLARLALLVASRLTRTPRLVPGPPKRFAQALGALVSLTALALFLAGNSLGTYIVLGLLLVPATLEAGLGYCVGCELFALGMRLGLVPESICLECADLYGKSARERRLSRS